MVSKKQRRAYRLCICGHVRMKHCQGREGKWCSMMCEAKCKEFERKKRDE